MYFAVYLSDLLTFSLLSTNHRPFASNVNQGQTAQNVRSDVKSKLSDKQIFLAKIRLKSQFSFVIFF